MRVRRWLIFAVVAVVFFAISIDPDIYNITSPPGLSFHVLLRKVYSIVAFALVGGSFVWASGASIGASALTVAAYSGVIEVAQFYVDRSLEGYGWNAFDVACGAVGGVLGALIPWVRVR